MKAQKVKKPHTTDWLSLESEMLKTKTDGRSFAESTSYGGVTLWWFVRFRLYHSAEANQWAQLLINCPHVFSVADLMYDFLTSLLCKFISTFSRPEKNRTGPRVLMFASSSGWREMRGSDGKSRKGDIMLDSIIKELKRRRCQIVTVTPLKYSISAVQTMIERLTSGRTIHRESNMYWSVKTWIKQYYATKYFRNVWRNILENAEKFLVLLEKYPVTRGMRHYFNSLFGHVVKQIEMAKEVVSEQDPDLIVVTSEYGFFERALVVAGKLKGIPTLAIQHGNIGPLHEGYIYPKGSISANGSIETPYCPVPDKTAVYGPYYYHLLTSKSSYPSSSVAITGQPRYDALTVVDRFADREKFCSKLQLDPNRNIVLVATQNLPTPKAQTFLRRILRALKTFPDLQIILKPHPKENEERYNEIVKSGYVNVTVLSRKADTFEALYNCDLLIAGFSTVITEATILGKPSVTVHIGGKEDPTPYYRDVTLRVYEEEDLVSTIRKGLYDEKTRGKLKKAGKDFVHEHVYRPDGKATERVVALIEEMMKKRKIG